MKVTFHLTNGQVIVNKNCTPPEEGWSWAGIFTLDGGTNPTGKKQTIHILWSQVVAIIEEEE